MCEAGVLCPESIGCVDLLIAGQGGHEGSPQPKLSCSKHTSLDIDAMANNMMSCGG